MARDQAEIEQKNRQCLGSFVVRARRVAEHTLAGDWEKLITLIDPKIGIRFENGEIRIRHELPAEEVVESAAARIRPILLATEDCFHMKALKALGYACRELPRDAEWVRAVRAEWKTRVDPATPLTALHPDAGRLDATQPDLGCAMGWAQVYKVRPRVNLACPGCGWAVHAKHSPQGVRFFCGVFSVWWCTTVLGEGGGR
ncbi:hypothetical protein ACF1BE_32500 [Streptomyces sp. NPDC014991]|uniref:hypothetical protein n=1 Tax=Streptomyces sp. NPDC014991 TaxID=3364935 RepID=UPI0036F4E5C0